MAIQGFTLFEVGALVGTAAVGLAVGSGQRPPRAGGLHRAGADYRHPRGLPTCQQPVRLSGLVVCAGLPGVWSAAVDRRRRRRFRTEKAIGAADGIKGTFAYLIGDSFAKLGLGMIADGTPVFGLTGWAGTFAALDAAAVGCICLMAIVAIFEERKIRREKKEPYFADRLIHQVFGNLARPSRRAFFISCALCQARQSTAGKFPL